jgi:beta-galactosidase
MKKEYPQVTYGAVYFRKSNPPKEDWERDYAQASADGMNMFRHWFLWSAIEIAPEVFDWSDYDKQMELAAKYNIGTVIAEFCTTPEWFFHENKDCYTELRDGRKAMYSDIGVSCATGGFVPGGMCLDNPKARHYTERFLRALANRYKGHPGLFGYDVWNECNYHRDGCYCEHTQMKFRAWLEKKYGSLKKLNEAW